MKYLPLYPDNRYNYFTTLEGESYSINIKWNTIDSAWYMDLKGISNDVDYKGLKLVGGCDLLYPYAILELGQMWVIDLQGSNQDPDFDNIGDRYKLLYLEIGESI